MIEATTPEKQIRAFTKRATDLCDRSEARRLVEDITAETVVWEKRWKSSKAKLLEMERQLLSIGEGLAEDSKNLLRTCSTTPRS